MPEFKGGDGTIYEADAYTDISLLKNYPLTAAVLDSYAAYDSIELPGLHQPVEDDDDSEIHDEHPFMRRRWDDAASAPAAAEAIYWLDLYLHRKNILGCKHLAAHFVATGNMEKARYYDERARTKWLPIGAWAIAFIAATDTPATREWRLRHNGAVEQAAAARHRRRLEQAAAAAMSALATANDAIADAGIATPTADDADGAADDDEEMDNAVAGDDEEPFVYQGPRP